MLPQSEKVEEIGWRRFSVEAPAFIARATEADENFPPNAAYRHRYRMTPSLGIKSEIRV